MGSVDWEPLLWLVEWVFGLPPDPEDKMKNCRIIIQYPLVRRHVGMFGVPSGNFTQLWKITMFNGHIHYFYGDFPIFSIVISVIARKYPSSPSGARLSRSRETPRLRLGPCEAVLQQNCLGGGSAAPTVQRRGGISRGICQVFFGIQCLSFHLVIMDLPIR